MAIEGSNLRAIEVSENCVISRNLKSGLKRQRKNDKPMLGEKQQ